MNRQLAGKVALVTGAGRNIGRAEAHLLAALGAKVVVNDVGGAEAAHASGKLADQVVEEIRASGGIAVADYTSIDSVAGGGIAVENSLRAFGRIDILINNAGTVRPNRIDQMSEEEWDKVLAVNLDGVFGTVHRAAREFIKQRSGNIVNTSSPSGFGHYAMANYAAAKEAVVGLTRCVARDLGHFGIRCNALRPLATGSALRTEGTVATIHDTRRLYGESTAYLWNRSRAPAETPTAESVAALAVWLCTDAAAALNGRELFIAGAELGLIQEPEAHRLMFQPGGWRLEHLDDSATLEYLIGDVRNRFPPKDSPPI